MHKCRNIYVDTQRGELICMDTGEVILDHLPAVFLGIEETSPARDTERLEHLYESANALKRRYRYYRHYRRIIRIIGKSKRRKAFTNEQLKYIKMVIDGTLTVWDVAKTLNVSPKTVYNWLRKARAEGWI